MRVALYSGVFKEDHDGATNTLFRLVESLRNQGVEVGIWTYSSVENARDHQFQFQLPSVPLPLFPDYRLSLPLKKLWTQLDEFRPDLIHIAVPDLTAISLVKYSQQRDIPVVASYHTNFPSYLDFFHLQLLKKTMWRSMTWLFNQMAYVYAPTGEAAAELRDNGVERIRIWSRGIDTERFNPRFRSIDIRKSWNALGKKVILYAGRLVPYKNLDTFVEIYRQAETSPDLNLRFVVAGEGPMRSKLEAVMPDAVFTGFLKGENLSKAYASADLFLFPSTTETIGNVVQEALASGIPAVVSDQGGGMEIVRCSNAGLIARGDNATDFLKKVRQLLADSTLYNRMRENGVVFAASKSWDRINGALIDDYHSLIGSGFSPTAHWSAVRPAEG